jgi:ParB family chromosome partitioning protein
MLLSSARWARGKAVDPVLAGLVHHSTDETRRKVVEALGWRLRKRGGAAEPLRKVLTHRDPMTQFFAAEGLARAGRGEGLNVLLASIDFATDLGIRQRAVQALGELADERALEVLLKLAGEDGHALQEPAAEAIGHLGRSSRADEVFKLLERHARGDTGVAWRALRGLRWLDTRAGWQVIRTRVADPSCSFCVEAVELLGYNDDPATRDLLLRLLAQEEDDSMVGAAMAAARRLWGRDGLEPDYAVLQNEGVVNLDDYDELVQSVCKRGDARRLLEIVSRCPAEVRPEVTVGLLSRADLPVAEAIAALDNPHPVPVLIAAEILGRAGARAAGKAAGTTLESALAKWRKIWEEKRPWFNDEDQDWFGRPEPASTITDCVRGLVWAAGRLGVARDAVVEAASARPDDPEYQPIRLAALLALDSGEGGISPKAQAALESAALNGAAEVRAAAAQVLARRHPKGAMALAERLLSDRVSFNRLTRNGMLPIDDTLRAAARQVHYQGVVLPGLIDRADVAALAAVAEDRTLPEATRTGAVEGLAAMGREPAEEVLRRIGARAGEDEELCKAAWRGLRRSQRARRKAKLRIPQAEVTS